MRERGGGGGRDGGEKWGGAEMGGARWDRWGVWARVRGGNIKDGDIKGWRGLERSGGWGKVRHKGSGARVREAGGKGGA